LEVIVDRLTRVLNVVTAVAAVSVSVSTSVAAVGISAVLAAAAFRRASRTWRER
jgi:hypothetical protein